MTTTTHEAFTPSLTFLQLQCHTAIHSNKCVYSVKYDPEAESYMARVCYDGTQVETPYRTRELAACALLERIYGEPYRTVTKHCDVYVECPAPGCDCEMSIEDHGDGPDSSDACRHVVEVAECGVVFVFPKGE